jgi:hypothetical protein
MVAWHRNVVRGWRQDVGTGIVAASAALIGSLFYLLVLEIIPVQVSADAQYWAGYAPQFRSATRATASQRSIAATSSSSPRLSRAPTTVRIDEVHENVAFARVVNEQPYSPRREEIIYTCSVATSRLLSRWIHYTQQQQIACEPYPSGSG